MQRMQSRRFTDSGGTEWEVYLLVSTPKIIAPQPAFSNQFRPTKAWLAFDSETERRRLSPAPLGWEELTVSELERLLALATKTAIVIKRDR